MSEGGVKGAIAAALAMWSKIEEGKQTQANQTSNWLLQTTYSDSLARARMHQQHVYQTVSAEQADQRARERDAENRRNNNLDEANRQQANWAREDEWRENERRYQEQQAEIQATMEANKKNADRGWEYGIKIYDQLVAEQAEARKAITDEIASLRKMTIDPQGNLDKDQLLKIEEALKIREQELIDFDRRRADWTEVVNRTIFSTDKKFDMKSWQELATQDAYWRSGAEQKVDPKLTAMAQEEGVRQREMDVQTAAARQAEHLDREKRQKEAATADPSNSSQSRIINSSRYGVTPDADPAGAPLEPPPGTIVIHGGDKHGWWLLDSGDIVPPGQVPPKKPGFLERGGAPQADIPSRGPSWYW